MIDGEWLPGFGINTDWVPEFGLDGEWIPEFGLDGEFLPDVNVSNPIDGELNPFSLIKTNNTIKTDDCKDPVEAKFGDNVWNKEWSGTWNFDKTG